MIGNNFGGPLTRVVLPLASDLLGELGDNTPGALVALRRPVATSRLAPRHHPLPPGKLPSSMLAVFRMRQIVFRVSGGSDRAHTPVDADRLLTNRQHRGVALHHETGVPMPDTVAIDTHTARRRGQLARPHHWNRGPTRQTQATSFDRESPLGVVQTRRSALAGLKFTAPLTLSTSSAEIPQQLLLGHHRTLTQPVMLTTPAGKRVVADPLPGLVKSRNRFIPHPPAAIPLSATTLSARPHQGATCADNARLHAPDPTVAVRHRPFLPD